MESARFAYYLRKIASVNLCPYIAKIMQFDRFFSVLEQKREKNEIYCRGAARGAAELPLRFTHCAST